MFGTRGVDAMATYASYPDWVTGKGVSKRQFFVGRVGRQVGSEHHRHGEDEGLVGESVG